MSEKGDRVRFSGYDVSNFKIFIFCLAAAISGIGGALFVLQVGFISPSLIGIVPSIEMVIFAAVGGKRSFLGAVYGTLLVNTIGMLLMQEPELMMLDEPVAGMSPAEREQTAGLLQRISANRSILVIEHVDIGRVKQLLAV